MEAGRNERLDEEEGHTARLIECFVTPSRGGSILDTEDGYAHVIITLYLHLRGMTPLEIHRQLSKTCGVCVMAVQNMRS